MCKCRYAEFVCSCTKDGCPHANPHHARCHAPYTVWQIDHFEWEYCPSALRLLVVLDVDSPCAPGIVVASSSSPDKTTATATSIAKTVKRVFSTTSSSKVENGRAKEMLLQALQLCGDRSETPDETVHRGRRRGSTTTDTQPQPPPDKEKSPSPPRPPRPAEDAELRSLLSGPTQPDGRRRTVESENNNQVVGVPVDASDDPRHGGSILDCDGIVYEGYRVKWACEFCEEYWLGRTGMI